MRDQHVQCSLSFFPFFFCHPSPPLCEYSVHSILNFLRTMPSFCIFTAILILSFVLFLFFFFRAELSIHCLDLSPRLRFSNHTSFPFWNFFFFFCAFPLRSDLVKLCSQVVLLPAEPLFRNMNRYTPQHFFKHCCFVFRHFFLFLFFFVTPSFFFSCLHVVFCLLDRLLRVCFRCERKEVIALNVQCALTPLLGLACGGGGGGGVACGVIEVCLLFCCQSLTKAVETTSASHIMTTDSS